MNWFILHLSNQRQLVLVVLGSPSRTKVDLPSMTRLWRSRIRWLVTIFKLFCSLLDQGYRDLSYVLRRLAEDPLILATKVKEDITCPRQGTYLDSPKSKNQAKLFSLALKNQLATFACFCFLCLFTKWRNFDDFSIFLNYVKWVRKIHEPWICYIIYILTLHSLQPIALKTGS